MLGIHLYSKASSLRVTDLQFLCNLHMNHGLVLWKMTVKELVLTKSEEHNSF